MMDGTKQSDSSIVAMKRANKEGRPSAEPVERRDGTKGKSVCQSTRRTQSRGSVSQAVDRIRRAIARNPKERLTALLHHITVEALRRAYLGLRKDAAPGIDGVRWKEYGAKLEERLLDLHRRVHRGAYRAPPVRRVNIPKPDGRTRPLGVAALEDKILQKAVVDELLTPIYEAEFLGLSYGFRPGRKAHDALDALAYGIERRKVNWIVDADIRTFFDAIDRDRLLRFVERRIGDRRVLRLLRKWLNAGVMEDGTWSDTGKGTPQGSIVSPLLANVYLHYVLDHPSEVAPRSSQRRGDPGAVCGRLRGRIPETGGRETVSPRPGETVRRVRAGTAPGKDATGGVRTICGSGSATTRGAETGDVRLSGVHALLCEDPEGTLPAGAEAKRETDEPDPATGGGEAVETTARGSLGGREMVEPGPERLAELFCGSGEYALAARFLLSAATAVAASLAPPVPTRPLQLGTVATDDGIALAIREDPSPVAGAAIPLAVHTQGRSRMP